MNNTAGLTQLNKIVVLDDFSDKEYYEIYLAIVDYFIDNRVPSYQDLKFKFKEDELIREIIEAVENETEAPDDITLIYNELCEVSKKRKLVQVGQYLQNRSISDSASEDIIRIAEAQLLQVTINSGIQIDTVADLEGEYIKDLKDKVTRYQKTGTIEGVIDLPTGYTSLDRLTLGLQKKDIWLLAGGTSDGKTEMAVQISTSVMMAENQVLFFMLEDDKHKLLNRYISVKTGISMLKLMCGNITDLEFEKAKQATTQLKQGDKLLIEDRTYDVNDIVAKAQFIKLKYPNLNLIVLDHINLITDRTVREAKREREIATAANKLVDLAKRIDVAVLILQQVSTAPDERKSGLPVTVNDIRDAKAVGHNASVIIMLHCPNRYDESAGFSKKHTQLIITKNRYGQVNKIIDFINHAHIGKFVEGVPKEKTTT
jgi:replicative DNA helicase